MSKQTGNNETTTHDKPESEQPQSERFMKAIDEVAMLFGDWSKQHSVLSRAAQNFDFCSSQPELAKGTVKDTAIALTKAIHDSDAPDEIVQIYSDAYNEVLDVYLEDINE